MADGDARFLLNTIEYISGAKFKKDLTPEMLENMKSIDNASDPAFKAFKDTVVDEVLNRVMDVDFKDLKGAENSEKPEETKEEKKESGEA